MPITFPIDHAELPDLEGVRCVLKPLLAEHVTPAYVGWLNDPEINQYLESRFARHDMPGVRDFVAAQLAHGGVAFYGIWARASEDSEPRHIGNIKLGPIDRNHLTADLGFLIGDRGFWGRGIATEAIALMVKFGFGLGLRKITAGAYENNSGSAKALVKAGFAEEGMRPSQAVYGDTRVGLRLFGIACS